MNGPALLTLQRLDSELDHLAGRRRRLPEHEALGAANAALLAWQTTAAGLRRTIEEATAAIATAETEGAAIDTKRLRLEAQLKTVIAPREAEALMSQIKTLQTQHGGLDDVELEAMERQNEAETALLALHRDEERLTSDLADAEASLAAALAVLAEEEQDLVSRRADAAALLTSEDIARYDAVRARHDRVAVVTIEGGRCTGCHLDISPAELDDIRHASGPELPDCPQCGRLVVV